MEQGVCYIRNVDKYGNYLNADGTFNIRKVSKQFVSAGIQEVKGIDSIAGISIDEKPDLLVDRVYAFIQNNLEAVNTAYFV